MITPDQVCKEAFQLMVEMSPWEIDKGEADEMTRQVFYMCGIIDMAQTICKRMEEKDG